MISTLLISKLDDSIVANFIVDSEYVMLLNNAVVSNDNVINDPEFDVLKLLIAQSLISRLEERTDKIISSEVMLLKEL